MTDDKSNNISGATWLQQNWPNCKRLDHDWTMERYDYPQYVRQYIKDNWVKVSDDNGGTYEHPEYFARKNEGFFLTLGSKVQSKENSSDKFSNNKPFKVVVSPHLDVRKIFQDPDTGVPGERTDDKVKINPSIVENMDPANKKVAGIMENEGMKAAVDAMFTDSETGRKLSYAEMRNRYG